VNFRWILERRIRQQHLSRPHAVAHVQHYGRTTATEAGEATRRGSKMNRWEESEPESKPDADEQDADDCDGHDEDPGHTEPATPLIDQNLAGSMNAALHDTDE
jgi:hypothetical protein